MDKYNYTMEEFDTKNDALSIFVPLYNIVIFQ